MKLCVAAVTIFLRHFSDSPHDLKITDQKSKQSERGIVDMDQMENKKNLTEAAKTPSGIS